MKYQKYYNTLDVVSLVNSMQPKYLNNVNL